VQSPDDYYCITYSQIFVGVVVKSGSSLINFLFFNSSTWVIGANILTGVVAIDLIATD
jgi:hypothetical protein